MDEYKKRTISRRSQAHGPPPSLAETKSAVDYRCKPCRTIRKGEMCERQECRYCRHGAVHIDAKHEEFHMFEGQ